jgi:hypothetical protein
MRAVTTLTVIAICGCLGVCSASAQGEGGSVLANAPPKLATAAAMPGPANKLSARPANTARAKAVAMLVATARPAKILGERKSAPAIRRAPATAK